MRMRCQKERARWRLLQSKKSRSRRKLTRRLLFQELEGRQLLNAAPMLVNPIPDQSADEDAPAFVVDLSTVFDDPDLAAGDNLTLNVQDNDNPAVASASVDGTTLTLNLLPDQHGTAYVTIRATD